MSVLHANISALNHFGRITEVMVLVSHTNLALQGEGIISAMFVLEHLPEAIPTDFLEEYTWVMSTTMLLTQVGCCSGK